MEVQLSMKKRKWLSLFLSIALTATLLPASALAEDDYSGELFSDGLFSDGLYSEEGSVEEFFSDGLFLEGEPGAKAGVAWYDKCRLSVLRQQRTELGNQDL